MTSLETRPSFGPTSAAGAMIMRQVREPVVVGCILAGLGTSPAYGLRRELRPGSQTIVGQTTAGAVLITATSPSHVPAGAAVGELRRLSGLTWEQLARLFDVCRRSLHFWASGKPMAARHEEHLQRLLSVMRKIDRGSASANRTALLGATEDGSIPLDLLVRGRYERVVSLLGEARARGATPHSLSEQAQAARAPRAPGELVDALQDRIHPRSGRLLAAKPIAVPRTK